MICCSQIQRFFWGDENVLELDIGGGCTSGEYTTSHTIVRFKGEFNGMWMASKNINWFHSYSVLLFLSQFPWEKWERKNDVFDLRTNPAHCSLSFSWAFSVLKHESWRIV